MTDVIGCVTGVSGAEMTVALDCDRLAAGRTENVSIGVMVKAATHAGWAVGLVSAIRTEAEGHRNSLTVDLLGELTGESGKALRFGRGVSIHPRLGSPVAAVTPQDSDLIYGKPEAFHARVGSIYQDESRPAFLITDDLLAKHFAIVGTTGSGKSCTVTLLLRAILHAHPFAHILLLDPHDEYAAAFGDSAEVFNVDNLQLPCWLLNFEELIAVLVRGGSPEEQQAQASILKDAVTQARRRFAGDGLENSWITVDTPVPFRVGDLIQIIDDTMGKLTKADTSTPYLRLKSRLESLSSDRRFRFMFAGAARPVAGKPLSIVDLSGLPSEIVDVVVSLLFRIIFDFAVWADRSKMPPILMICEEAHRYVPADQTLGFAASTRAIARISKEGRKYGISLGLVTQRPSELAPTVLTQCGTLFALRLSNELDQQFVASALPDSSHGMLAALPSLRRQEAIVVGEGVPIPMRICFDSLPPQNQPHSGSAHFSRAWQADAADTDFIEEGVRRWRRQMRDRSSADSDNTHTFIRKSLGRGPAELIIRGRSIVSNFKR
jgi:DNA helicase HerA-like ATPase